MVLWADCMEVRTRKGISDAAWQRVGTFQGGGAREGEEKFSTAMALAVPAKIIERTTGCPRTEFHAPWLNAGGGTQKGKKA